MISWLGRRREVCATLSAALVLGTGAFAPVPFASGASQVDDAGATRTDAQLYAQEFGVSIGVSIDEAERRLALQPMLGEVIDALEGPHPIVSLGFG